MVPEVRFAKTRDSISIAYYVVGDGPFTLVLIPGWHGNLEIMWEQPLVAGFYEKLGEIGRVIHHDPRGTGLSDRRATLPDLETSVDDLCAVLDRVGARRVVPVGFGAGVPLAVMFATSRPERTAALVLYAARVKGSSSEDYPWGYTEKDREEELRMAREAWGTESNAAWYLSADEPSLQDDRELIRWEAKVERHWISPGDATEMIDRYYRTDVRHLLPAIHAPTLVLRKSRWEDADEEEHVASLIPGAKLESLPGEMSMPFFEHQDSFVGAIGGFLEGLRRSPKDFVGSEQSRDRVLATLLFTDIVGSTGRAAQLGDAAWTDIVAEHDAIVRRELARQRGSEVDRTGDGFLVMFDGPARAIRCALAIADAVRGLGIEVRGGCHTGEVELVDGGIRGIAVHIGARVMALAGASEVLVSSTVRDLVAGSGLSFVERGEHELKGVPGTWPLFAARDR